MADDKSDWWPPIGTDYVMWCKAAAHEARAFRGRGTRHDVDWRSVADNLDAAFHAEWQSLRAHVRGVIETLVIMRECNAYPYSRDGVLWRHRRAIEDTLRHSPSMRADLGKVVREETPHAIRLAMMLVAVPDPNDAGLSFTAGQVCSGWRPPWKMPAGDAFERPAPAPDEVTPRMAPVGSEAPGWAPERGTTPARLCRDCAHVQLDAAAPARSRCLHPSSPRGRAASFVTGEVPAPVPDYCEVVRCTSGDGLCGPGGAHWQPRAPVTGAA